MPKVCAFFADIVLKGGFDMNYLLIALIGLTSCGQITPANGVNSNATASSTQTDTSVATDTQKATDAVKPTQTTIPAKLVDTAEKLPNCESKTFGDLFYVKESAEFQYCDDSTSEWTVINLKGPQGDRGASGASGAVGETGPQGAAGTNGVDGKNGIAGQAGSNGTNGSIAKALEPNEWVDPITNLEWIVGTLVYIPYVNTTTLCAVGSRLATANEFHAAYLSGIFNKFQKYSSENDCDFIGTQTSCFETNGNVIEFSTHDLTIGNRAYVLCVIPQ